MTEFDPDNVNTDTLKALGNHIETYLDFFKSGMIIPPSLRHKEKDEAETEAIVRKLIKHLKKGQADKVLIDRDD